MKSIIKIRTLWKRIKIGFRELIREKYHSTPYRLLPICLLLTACKSPDQIKHEQYFVEGLELYKIHCANCHQMDGKGLSNLYPTIAGSDYLLKNKERIICAMRFGQADTIVVNGKTYNQPMPANAQLKDLDIAEITTYIYNQWGDEKGITESKEVTPILEKCQPKL